MPDKQQASTPNQHFAKQKPDFPVPSYSTISDERNKIKFGYSDGNLIFSNEKENFGYTVTEAREKNPLRNTSIQEVSFILNQPKDTAAAGLVSTDKSFNGSGITSSLVAMNNGAVFYTQSSAVEELLNLSPSIMVDITHATAKAGMTAAGIRRTQYDIAKDGEITRPEQTTIINMLQQAKTLAGL